jgi:hypothetical protein
MYCSYGVGVRGSRCEKVGVDWHADMSWMHVKRRRDQSWCVIGFHGIEEVVAVVAESLFRTGVPWCYRADGVSVRIQVALLAGMMGPRVAAAAARAAVAAIAEDEPGFSELPFMQSSKAFSGQKKQGGEAVQSQGGRYKIVGRV